jgi:hypothetical protein
MAYDDGFSCEHGEDEAFEADIKLDKDVGLLSRGKRFGEGWLTENWKRLFWSVAEGCLG